MSICRRGHDRDVVGVYAGGQCRACNKINQERWRAQHRERHLEHQRAANRRRFARKPDVMRAERAAWARSERFKKLRAKWRAKPENKKKEQTYMRKRLREDLGTRLCLYLRNRQRAALKRNKKASSAVKALGTSPAVALQLIAQQFEPGMTWENWKRGGWVLDHYVPLAAFDLTDSIQASIAGHYTNLRPCWDRKNGEKGSKIPEEMREAVINKDWSELRLLLHNRYLSLEAQATLQLLQHPQSRD